MLPPKRKAVTKPYEPTPEERTAIQQWDGEGGTRQLGGNHGSLRGIKMPAGVCVASFRKL